MKELKLKTGVLLIPKDWIVVENIPLENADYAGVIETLNCEKGFPHFVFFGEKEEDVCRPTKEERNNILRLCANASSSFMKVYEEYLLIPKDENGEVLDWLSQRNTIKEPIVHRLYDKDEFDPKEWDYPFGAMIVRIGDKGGE